MEVCKSTKRNFFLTKIEFFFRFFLIYQLQARNEWRTNGDWVNVGFNISFSKITAWWRIMRLQSFPSSEGVTSNNVSALHCITFTFSGFIAAIWPSFFFIKICHFKRKKRNRSIWLIDWYCYNLCQFLIVYFPLSFVFSFLFCLHTVTVKRWSIYWKDH